MGNWSLEFLFSCGLWGGCYMFQSDKHFSPGANRIGFHCQHYAGWSRFIAANRFPLWPPLLPEKFSTWETATHIQPYLNISSAFHHTPTPPHIQSDGRLSPQNTFRDPKRRHEGHHTTAHNTGTAGKHPSTRDIQSCSSNSTEQTNKQKHPHTLSKKKKKKTKCLKCSKVKQYFHIMLFSHTHV